MAKKPKKHCRECEYTEVIRYEKDFRSSVNRTIRVCRLVDTEVDTLKPLTCEHYKLRNLMEEMRFGTNPSVR